MSAEWVIAIILFVYCIVRPAWKGFNAVMIQRHPHDLRENWYGRIMRVVLRK